MPTILISTLDDEGKTTIGAYSLCFPYYIAGKDYYAMILECRNSSNTAQNLLKNVYNDAKVLSFTVGYAVFEADASAPYDQYFEKDGSARYEFSYSFADYDGNIPEYSYSYTVTSF